jgi:hypothetical protein
MATLRIAVVLAAAALAAFPIQAQVLVETGILSSPKKPTDPINSKWDKAMGESGKKAAPKKTTVPPAPAASTKPKVLPETFSGETEDPMSILGIDADVLTRFSTALAAESKRRSESPPLKRLQYEELVAPVGGFTPRQYWVLKERVRPFCEAIAANLPPSDNLTLSYMPSEAAAIRPRCAELLPALQLNR